MKNFPSTPCQNKIMWSLTTTIKCYCRCYHINFWAWKLCEELNWKLSPWVYIAPHQSNLLKVLWGDKRVVKDKRKKEGNFFISINFSKRTKKIWDERSWWNKMNYVRKFRLRKRREMKWNYISHDSKWEMRKTYI